MPLSPRLRWKLDRFREKLSGVFGARKEDSRPRLCPACGTLVGSTATRCHQCGTSLTFSLAAASRSLQGILPTTSPATYIILGLSCILYVFSYMITLHLGGGGPPSGGGFAALFNLGAIDPRALQVLGASLPLPINLAQPWRFVMAVFLHGSLLHIGFNMWVLLDVGPLVEETYGSARFFFIYVVTGIGGYLLSSFLGKFSVGGSGALLGLIGVLLAMTWSRRSAGMQMLRSQLIRWLVYLVIWGVINTEIDNAAHFGGLVAGFLLGKVMVDRAPVAPEERKRANILGLAAGLAVIAGLVMAVRSYLQATG
ncbi:MAG TPA: rhomboid family intramembrane serine protease [Candidatus Micrarchaeaceae archaeon]|nr:rhomboid family intramembrane serine protease [Candidatus Micrarchaeaceae archaeon]